MFSQRHRDSDRSACATHCEQRLQLREQKTLTETSQEVTSSADACLSLAHVAFKLCVVVKWSGDVQQGTGVQLLKLLTVEQEHLSLGTDVKNTLRFKTCSHYPTRRLQVRVSIASLGSQ